ncbi:hypothetical protein ACH4RG_25105 [Streptomyces sp. NPDC021019]|uniref:hypothetical protein n=1 Tax=Streptomyces sp. NPDC021019 TaxID=3365108 RepID=UPI00379CEDE6
MIKSRLTRVAVVAGAAALIAASVAPAQAVEAKGNMTIYLPKGRGKMIFHDDGDVFKICDTKADGHGVTGYLYKQGTTGSAVIAFKEADGGDAGCDKHPYNVGRLANYQMQLFWNGGGSVLSKWFNE